MNLFQDSLHDIHYWNGLVELKMLQPSQPCVKNRWKLSCKHQVECEQAYALPTFLNGQGNCKDAVM